MVKQTSEEVIKAKNKKLVLKWVAAAVVVIGIFILGINVGNGRLGIHQFSSATGLPANIDYSTVNQVYDLIKDNYDGSLTTSQVLDGLKNGLAQSTNDPYTEYFNASQAAAYNNELSETFSGIGAELGENSQNEITVVAPIAGFPAAKAGLQDGDIITKINGQATTNMTIDQAVDAIHGPAGTKVTLSIVRGSQQLSLTITRANITVPSVTSSVIDGDIGYMQISQFTSDTASLAQTAAQQFSNEHVKGVIVDLRDNPGGLVDAAVSVSSLWVQPGKTILQEKRGSDVIQSYSGQGGDILNGIPTVILVNGGTASASEITTGAIHDNGLAEVIGTKTYGKGVVQQIFNLDDGGELKVTIAKWYRPDGQNINKLGITPDMTVQNPATTTTDGPDPQKAAAITWIQQH